VTAVGDVRFEIELRLTLRGTVRELATFMEALTSSEVVVGFGQAHRDGQKCETISDFSKQFCSDSAGQKR